MAEEFGVKVKLIPEFDSNALKTAASAATGKNGVQVNLLPVIDTKGLQSTVNAAAKNLVLNIDDVKINGKNGRGGSGGSGGNSGSKKSTATNIEPLIKYYKNLVDYVRKNPSVQKSKTLSSDLSNEKSALAGLVRNAIQTGSYDRDKFTNSKNKVAAIQNAARIRGLEDTATPNKVAAALQKQVEDIRAKTAKYSASASDTAKVEAELKRAEGAIHQLGQLGTVSAESFGKIESSAKATIASADNLASGIKESSTDTSTKMSVPNTLLKQIQGYRAANPRIENYKAINDSLAAAESQLRDMMGAGQYSKKALEKIRNVYAEQQYGARLVDAEEMSNQKVTINGHVSALEKLKKAREEYSKSGAVDSGQMAAFDKSLANYEQRINELRGVAPDMFDQVAVSAQTAGSSVKGLADNIDRVISDTSTKMSEPFKLLNDIQNYRAANPSVEKFADKRKYFDDAEAQLKAMMSAGQYSRERIASMQNAFTMQKYDAQSRGIVQTPEQKNTVKSYLDDLNKLKQQQESLSKGGLIDTSKISEFGQKIADAEAKVKELGKSTPGAFERVNESAKAAALAAKKMGSDLATIAKDTSQDMVPVVELLNKIASMKQPNKISLLNEGEVERLNECEKKLNDIRSSGRYRKSDLLDITSDVSALSDRQNNSQGIIKQGVMAMAQGVTVAYGFRTAFYKAKQVATEMVTAVRDINDALTQLTIVTGKSGSELDSFFQKAADSAYNMGHSVTEVLGSVETFTRLGYGLEDASTLADAATVMSNVADTTVDASTTGLTSIIKGYGLEASDATRVSDVLAKVGKDYAISAEELMSALERGGAALNVANTSFEQSVALAAAGNAAIQDPEKVGGQQSADYKNGYIGQHPGKGKTEVRPYYS